MKLEEADYRSTQALLLQAASIMSLLELDAFLNTLAEADALGPILDPTSYRAAMHRLRDIRELALAAERVKAIWLRLQARLASETEARAG